MGKKSRRPNRNNKPKGIPAAASTAVPAPASSAVAAPPRQVVATATDDDVATFNQLYKSEDWAGILELESKMSVIAKTFESSNPSLAGRINFILGDAHKEMGRGGGH